jgi:hypothetical protein
VGSGRFNAAAHAFAPKGSRSMGRFQIVAEYFAFLRQEKKWWMFPIAAVLLLFGSLVLLTQGSPLAPFIYTLF